MKNEEMMVAIESIEMDASTQCRDALNEDAIEDYAERMDAGDEFPPVELFGSTEKCWIGDGWHRIKAALKSGRTTIEANLHSGGRTEAVRHAAGANKGHGVQRTNADKRKAVEVALKAFTKMSDRMLADICGVDHKTVSTARTRLEATGESPQLEVTNGKDGKPRRARKVIRSKKPAADDSGDREKGADCTDEPASPVSPEKPVTDGEAQTTVDEEVGESSDTPASATHVVDAAMTEPSLDKATLAACRGLLDKVSAQRAAKAIKKLKALIEKGSENSESLSEPYAQVQAILDEATVDCGGEGSWLLLRRIWEELARDYSSSEGCTKRDALVLHHICRRALVYEKPLLDNLRKEFAALEASAAKAA